MPVISQLSGGGSELDQKFKVSLQDLTSSRSVWTVYAEDRVGVCGGD